MIRHGSTPLYPQETMGSLADRTGVTFKGVAPRRKKRSSGQVDILTLKRREI